MQHQGHLNTTKGKFMSIIVTSWQTASLTLGNIQDFNEFINQNSQRGFEVKAMSTYGITERNGNLLQFYNVLMQRPVAWSDSDGQVSYPD
jgi:hypothetical protein